MSYRAWLQLWPRTVRLLTVTLVLLFCAAPSWHICDLGLRGHRCHAPSGELEKGHDRHGTPGQYLSISSGGRGALICYCPPSQDQNIRALDATAPDGTALESVQNAAQLQGDDPQPQCLAMLLQSLPGQSGSPAPPVASRFLEERPEATPKSLITRRSLLLSWGRAPPVRVNIDPTPRYLPMT